MAKIHSPLPTADARGKKYVELWLTQNFKIMADNNMVYVNDKQQLDAIVNKDVNAVKDKMQEKQDKSFITFDPFYDYIEDCLLYTSPSPRD